MTVLRQFNKVRDGRKTCPTCGETKPVAEYSKKLSGVASACKTCTSVLNRARLYGLSRSEQVAMLTDPKCEACGTADFGKRGPQIDHCHTSGVVGGVLCAHCNLMFGLMGDDPERLRAMAAYLERVRPHLAAIA